MKKNKILVMFLSITIIIISCNNNLRKKQIAMNVNNKANVTQVVVLYENLSTLTFSRVPCNRLEQVFKLKTKIIKNTNTINIIIKSIEKTIEQQNYINKIDARYQMILIYKSKERDTLCGDGGGIKFNNKIYKIDRDFSNLLKNLTEASF